MVENDPDPENIRGLEVGIPDPGVVGRGMMTCSLFDK